MKKARPAPVYGLRGKVANGFAVAEMLGSCQSGLLYLANNPATGETAIVREVTGENDADTKVFLREATSFLPANAHLRLVRTTLDDGTVIHLAVMTTKPRPKAPAPAPTLRTHAAALSALAALGCVAAIVTLLLLRPKPLPVVVLSSGEASAPACVPDAAWRATMHHELDELASTLADDARVRFDHEPAIDIERAQTPDACALVSTAVAQRVADYRTPCHVTAQWATERRRELEQLSRRVELSHAVPTPQLQALQQSISLAITTAATTRDCADVTASLQDLRSRAR